MIEIDGKVIEDVTSYGDIEEVRRQVAKANEEQDALIQLYGEINILIDHTRNKIKNIQGNNNTCTSETRPPDTAKTQRLMKTTEMKILEKIGGGKEQWDQHISSTNQKRIDRIARGKSKTTKHRTNKETLEHRKTRKLSRRKSRPGEPIIEEGKRREGRRLMKSGTISTIKGHFIELMKGRKTMLINKETDGFVLLSRKYAFPSIWEMRIRLKAQDWLVIFTTVTTSICGLHIKPIRFWNPNDQELRRFHSSLLFYLEHKDN
ncbi:hypothetical protein HUJ05_010121 [Dendroctonus ponderosae]|nr:hypothetical protein HUJ05_010121 [Dendroctonus ponderosae]